MWTQLWFVLLAGAIPLLGVLLLNALADAPADAQIVTAGMALLWAVDVTLLVSQKPPQNQNFLATLDLIGGLGVLWCWLEQRARWKAALVWLFGFAIVLEMIKWGPCELAPDLNDAAHRNVFTAIRRGVFYSQLVCAGWVGGGLVAVHLGRLLSGHTPGRRQVGAL